jgi:uncharacterized protein YfaS (alpha-2-macroglobulin family)
LPPGWQWFVISDLGVTTMSGVDGLHVFVRSLGTAEAKAGVTVELLNRPIRFWARPRPMTRAMPGSTRA